MRSWFDSGAVRSLALVGLSVPIAFAAPARAQCPPLKNFDGPVGAVAFGASVAVAHDTNPARRAIVAISAPSSDQDATFSPKGRVYVHQADGGLLFTFFGEAFGDEFGRRVAILDTPAGQLIAVGAPGHAQPAGARAGSVYFFAASNGAPLGQAPGLQLNGQFGYALAPAGDFNADTVPDLIATAITAGAGASGRVYVISGLAPFSIIAGPFDAPAGHTEFGAAVADAGFGPTGGRRIAASSKDAITGAGAITIFDSSNAAVIRTLHGDVDSEQFGEALASADVDLDGRLDIIVGSPAFTPAALTGAGRVTVWSGATGLLLHHAEGEAAADHFGSALAVIGDVDHDSKPDFLASAPGVHSGRIDTGEVDTLSGADAHRIKRLLGPGDVNSWPTSLAARPDADFNSDARPDICVGAPLASFAGITRGAAFIYAGGLPPADINRDGVVNSSDLGLMLGAWGPCPGACPADFNADGAVNSSDLGLLLGAWGGCS